MLNRHDIQSIQSMIEQSDFRERDFLEAHARMEIDIINNQCLNRTMSDAEVLAYEFAIETIAQLQSGQHQGSWWHKAKKQDEKPKRYHLSH